MKEAAEGGSEELLRYRGDWKLEGAAENALEGDKGLVAKTPAAHHAISTVFQAPLNPKGKTLVVQYEVKLQQGLECGGAYMKLLTYDPAFDPAKFDDKTPYTIMFGPDRCGSTNKVHFIFRHKNPKNGSFEEKHLSNPPSAKYDKNTNLYTLIVKSDNSFEIQVNQEKVSSGSLLKDFTPSVNPPKGEFEPCA